MTVLPWAWAIAAMAAPNVTGGHASRRPPPPPADRVKAPAPSPPEPVAVRLPVARSLASPRTVPELVDDSLTTLTAVVRARGLRVDVHRESARPVRQYAPLRRALLALIADTVETTRSGGALAVRTKDLAGGRVEILIEDDSISGTVLERASGPVDRSGRTLTLRDALRDLDSLHGARVVAGAENGRRRLLMDIGFPNEE